MATHQPTTFSPNVPILDEAGRDWTWAFVVYHQFDWLRGFLFGSDGSVWTNLRRVWITGSRGCVSVADDHWRPAPLSITKYGYLKFSVNRNGKLKTYLVHQMIMLAFWGERPAGMQTLHGDGNYRNNSTRNLRYGTQQENMDDAKRHGRIRRGSQVHLAKLNDETVRDVRKSFAAGETQKSIAVRIGVTQDCIYDVCKKHTWKHV